MAHATSKLEAVRQAKMLLGDVSPEQIAAFAETTFGVKIPPAIVAVLLASLLEREALEASRHRVLELLEQARIEQQASGQTTQKKPRRRKTPPPDPSLHAPPPSPARTAEAAGSRPG